MSTTSFRGQPRPKPKPAPPPPPPPPAAPLAVLLPLPPEIAADAVYAAWRLITGIQTDGVHMGRRDVALCHEVTRKALAGEPLSWWGAGRVLRLARLHLAPPA